MPSLSQRLDRATVTATLLPLPKGKKRGRAIGFCGGNPVASIQGAGDSAPPHLWINGSPQPITFREAKKVVGGGTSASQLAGCWYTPKHDERAVVWTRSGDDGMHGVELHPDRWDKSNAVACGDGQQIGYGYERFAKEPCKALLWSGTRESLVVLTGPDPTQEAKGAGVSQGVQVGSAGGSFRKHACLWRGATESWEDLHPAGAALLGSDALGIGGGQQVGHAWGESMLPRAALWSGSAATYADLAPAGFARSTSVRCAGGFQVGWASEDEGGLYVRAILWNGAADDWLDLQQSLPAPWNVSQAIDIDVDGDTLRILGTAGQMVKSGGYDMSAGEQPLLWEMKLVAAEPPARREAPIVVQTTATGPEPVSDELRVERAAAALGRAIVDEDYDAAHALLAPWLQAQVTPAQLGEIIRAHFLDDVKPVDCAISGNDSTLDELRDSYREYYKDDATRTLASAESFGDWGPPSIAIAEQVTPANFRQWLSLELTPELDDPSGLDYCLRLWLIVVELDGTMRIGHLEPGD